jgi:Trk K+ transport system NAD-binding subunit
MRFGDAEDPDFLESLPLKDARWVVSTLPEVASNQALLHALRANGYAGRVAVAVRDEYQAQVLAASGIDRVFNLFDDAAEQATRQVCEALLADGPQTPQPHRTETLP